MNAGPSHAEYLARRHFRSLDGIRCISIAAVLWHHAPAHDSVAGESLLARGFLGVNLFFVLSGFLITTLLLREEDKHGRISLPAFYLRRVLRILPAYYLLIAAVSLYYCVYKGQSELAAMVPYYFAFLSNFLKDDIPLLAPTWSLSVEEQYYLLWPAVLCLTSGGLRWVRAVLLPVVILALVVHATGVWQWHEPPGYEVGEAIFGLPAEGYSAILLGAWLAFLMHSPRGYAVLAPLCAWTWAPLLWGGVLLVSLLLLPQVLAGWPMFLVHVLMTLLVGSVVMREDQPVARPLQARFVVRIGEISYGLYLLHLVGLHLAEVLGARLPGGLAGSVWVVTALYVPISIGLAELSFRWYEAPFLRLKSRFGAR
ncbi:MAG: O-acetyltransferase OatA [Planctomycetota bacterium]|jgi:peptidoglycan/LPS O-acetylase OafA/YrhL